jgi:uncharacterized protein (DUF983 family)
LFKGFLDVRPRCEACGFDLARADSGDGPAVFVIFVVGFIVVGLALWTEVRFSPPYWLHVVLWLPLTVALTFGLLRPFKATLIALQFKHKATQDIEFADDEDEANRP